MKIGNRTFTSGTRVMAILNLTPDSFYDVSRTTGDDILSRVKCAVDEGAEVIDIGAQSTRPQHTPISQEQEWQRLQGVVKLIKNNFDIPLSVDTYYPYVAQRVLEEGADMINDIWGLQYESRGEMAKVIAKFNASVCIMHNQNRTSSDDRLLQDIFDFLEKSLDIALRAGIDRDKIVIDGGIGFGKTKEQNFLVVSEYHRLHRLGYPLLLGVSRKSMFGGEIEDRLQPTLEATRGAVRQKVRFVRVHDVKENVEAIRQEEKKENP